MIMDWGRSGVSLGLWIGSGNGGTGCQILPLKYNASSGGLRACLASVCFKRSPRFRLIAVTHNNLLVVSTSCAVKKEWRRGAVRCRGHRGRTARSCLNDSRMSSVLYLIRKNSCHFMSDQLSASRRWFGKRLREGQGVTTQLSVTHPF